MKTHQIMWLAVAAVLVLGGSGLAWAEDDPSSGGVWDTITTWVDNEEIEEDVCVSSEDECECDPDSEESSEGNDCVHISIFLGKTRGNSSMRGGRLRYMELEPSPQMYTPQSLLFVQRYAMAGIGGLGQTPAGVPRNIWMVHPYGFIYDFVFADDESVASSTGASYIQRDRLMMVDAEGWATTQDPAYYDLYVADGSRYRFLAVVDSPDFGKLVEYRAPSGRIETLDDVGYDVVRDAEGLLRQVRSPSLLADIQVVHAEKFQVRLYADGDIGGKTNGLYPVLPGAEPVAVHTFEKPNPGLIRDMRYTFEENGSSRVSDFTHNPDAQGWTLRRYLDGGDFIDDVKIRETSDDRNRYQYMKWLTDSSGIPFAKQLHGFESISGPEGSVRHLRTLRVQDPDGEALTTTYAFYTNAVHLGLRKHRINPDGSWTAQDYDAQGRKTVELSPWLDEPAAPPENVTAAADTGDALLYDYAPLVPEDVPVFNDQRPRTTTRTVLGQVVQRTWNVYATNAAGARMEIEERAATPVAAFGAPGNLRTTQIFYGPADGNALLGRLRSVEHPDGRLETHAYEAGDWDAAFRTFTPNASGQAFRTTVTRGTTAHPDGIPERSTRDATVLDRFGFKVYTETLVRTDTGWEELSWDAFTHNIFGHQTAHERSTGELITGEKRAGCCGSDDETTPDGVQTQTRQDVLKRTTSIVKFGADGHPDRDLIREFTYDPAGRRLTETLRDGADTLRLVTSNTYDTAGRLLQRTGPDGLAHQTAYSGDGRTTTRTAPGGGDTITTRHRDGRIQSITGTAAVGVVHEYGVEEDGTQWTRTRRGPDGPLSPDWDLTVTDMLGRTIRTERPGFGGVTRVTTYEYDTAGRLVRVAPSDAPATLHLHDAHGERAATVLDLNGNGLPDLAGPDRVTSNRVRFVKINGDWFHEAAQYILDQENSAAPRLVSTRRERLTGLGILVSGLGLCTAESIQIDALGQTTATHVYLDRDAKTRIETTETPHSTQAIVRTMVNGLLVSNTTATGLIVAHAHDALERPVALTDPRTGTAVTAYDAAGRVASRTDAAAHATTYAYDPATGRRIAVTDPLGQTLHTAYDIQGRVLATWGATYPVAYEYDGFGRMIAMATTRDNTAESINLLTLLPAGLSLSDVSDPSYPPELDTTRWLYDPATGLLTQKLYADGKGTAYTYAPDGKLATRTWARGITTTYAYDAAGQLSAIQYSDSTPAVSFTYDRIGRQTTLTDILGTRTNEYHAATLQLVAERYPDGSTLGRLYDPLGRPAGVTLDTHYSVAYGYDDLGRFASVSSTVDSVPFVANYSYIPGSDLIGQVSSAQVQASTTYEPHRNLKTQVLNQHGTNLISQFDYENDAAGRRTVRMDGRANPPGEPSAVTNTFGYNLRSELTSAIMPDPLSAGVTNTFAYQYDPIGNRQWASLNAVTNRYEANELNQYVEITDGGVIEPLYDDDGNMLEYGDWTFAWDGENRLISVASNGTPVVQNQYDYMSRRIMKTTASQTHTFLYDGWNLIREDLGAATLSSRFYVWGLDLSGSLQGAGGVGGLLAVATTANDMSAIALATADANGNITEYVDGGGSIVARYEYDAFGNEISRSGAEAQSYPFRFSTKYFDDETGLYYYGYRFYNPGLGRWVNRDPIEEEGGVNLYAIVLNSIPNAFDPVGLDTWAEDVDVTGSICLFTSYTATFTLTYDDDACTITISDPVYSGITVAPPNSTDDPANLQSASTLKNEDCCTDTNKVGKKKQMQYVFRVRSYTVHGIKGWGIRTLRSTTYIYRYINCKCKE